MEIFMWLGGLACALFFGVGVKGAWSAEWMRMRRIERKLDLLIEHFGVKLERETVDLPDVWALVREGNHIQAIKLYREKTGAGLAEAKERIDKMIADLEIEKR